MTLWNQTYYARGNLATKIKQLAKPDLFPLGDKKYYFFGRYIDVIECGAIIGFKEYNDAEKYENALKNLNQTNSSEDLAEIPINTILNEQKKLKFLFRLIMLNENIRGLSLKEKTDHAFRNESNELVQADNELLFNNFVQLGVEVLYDQIKNARNPEACLDIMSNYIL